LNEDRPILSAAKNVAKGQGILLSSKISCMQIFAGVRDTTPIPGPSRGLSDSANLTAQVKFMPDKPLLPWYDGSAILMSTFKCSTLSHPTGDIEKNINIIKPPEFQ